MSLVYSPNVFNCPSCGISHEFTVRGRVQCPNCRWIGDYYSFSPRVLEIEEAVAALPQDATCIHHPSKKAIAVCAGTGDYVCALCAIELNGQTYSAEYLNTAGKNVATKAFDRTLPRPDSQISLYLICCFIPYVNAVFILFAFIWIPHAIYLYFKLLRMRKENPILQRLVGKGRLITLPIFLGLFTLGWIAGVVVLVLAIQHKL